MQTLADETQTIAHIQLNVNSIAEISLLSQHIITIILGPAGPSQLINQSTCKFVRAPPLIRHEMYTIYGKIVAQHSFEIRAK
jgi:hypothetical protein